MFRSARQIKVEAATKKLDKYRDHWKRTADQWFDGSVESVDKRIASLDQVIAFAGDTVALAPSRVASFCLAALPNLRASREELVALRRDLLAGDFGEGLHGDMWAPWREHGLIDPDAPAFPDKADWGGPAGHGRGFVAPGGNNGYEDVPPQGMAARRDPEGRECITCPKGVERFSKLDHAAREFIEGQNTGDRDEFLIRAQRLAETHTSTWPVDASARVVRAFVGAVGEQIPRPMRTAAREITARVQDFEDHLMFS